MVKQAFFMFEIRAGIVSLHAGVVSVGLQFEKKLMQHNFVPVTASSSEGSF